MSLRDQVLRGGFFLVLRQGLGMIVGAVGVLLLTRAIGPLAYGQYVAAFALLTYLSNLSQLGINVYLIRHTGEMSAATYHAAFSLLLVLSGIGMLLGLAAIPLLTPWLRLENFGPLVAAMIIGLPLQLAIVVPMSRFERALDYGRVAWIEVAGRLVCYAVALPLAYMGFGAWAAVAGWWSELVTVLVSTYAVSGFRPRLCWHRALAREMVHYGLSYSGAAWIRQLSTLINPLLLGRFLGAEAVGYVALTVRIVESLSFVMMASWRLSMSALSRVQQDRARLTQAITEGSRLQLIALGAPLMAFGWLSPWVVPLLFGSRWIPVTEIYPFVALHYLTNATFNLQLSALYVVKRNREVALINTTHVGLMAAGTVVLTPHLGLAGYGWALVLALLSCGVSYYYTARHIGRPDYRLSALWWTAMALALFWLTLGAWTAAAIVAALLWPATLRELKKYAKEFRRMFGGANQAVPDGKDAGP
ncbi:MAG: oligosaccharide flippase family protein [Verrucomicrobia bacterium]|nr:oligosaccharide flippase family protein [Verrucomicrobiota bacterium]